MPYRVRESTVQVQRPSGWKTLKVHKTKQAARKHMKALNANVTHKKPKYKKRIRKEKRDAEKKYRN